MAKTKPKTIGTIADLTPDPANVNQGTERGHYQLDWSLTNLGAGRSILADADGVVIAGNKTLEIAADHQLPVRVIETDGHELVVVQRTDLRLLGKGAEASKARQLAIADNRISETNYAADVEQLLAHQAAGVDLSPLYLQNEIDALLASLTPALPEAGGGGDDFDPDTTEIETRCKAGELWLIRGNGITHRLLCGDSTKAEDVTRILGNDKPHLMVTDPPYGVDYEADWRNKVDRLNGKPYGARAIGRVANDTRVDWTESWRLFPGDVIYCWHAGRHASDVQRSLEMADFEIRCQIIWAKNNFAISRGDYHWKHEPCWYAVRKGKTGHWTGDRSQTTLWEIDKPLKSETGHSTQKPIECMERPIRNNSIIKDMIYDPFAGSGTTLIACHRTGRQARLIEIESKYCDVILVRAEAEGLIVEREV